MPLSRPKDEKELQRREAIGVIRASRFVRRYAQMHKPITIQTICAVHREIFRDAWPEIAGVSRIENLEITDSEHRPPHYSEVIALLEIANIELQKQLLTLSECKGIILDLKNAKPNDAAACIDRVIRVAAWLHHTITYIHPFREGNGRTARLASNLILERYGLIGISVKVEKENKNAYRNALVCVDKYQDYELLTAIIYEGLAERYNGVVMKYYEA